MVVLSEISEASSSSSSSPIYVYDVFLSFRGTDTLCNFTDQLHMSLLDAGINTFLDDCEIQTGEDLKPELESAIKASRSSIIVLSEDYASSTWCLNELVMILQQCSSSKHFVIPIFYHVKPTDVRNQQSTFRDAMARHKQKMDAEPNEEKRSQWAHNMKQWEEALTKVGSIKGEEANGRRETILIERIVKDVSNRLELHKRSKIPHLIGREPSVRTVTSFLRDESSNSTEILTIWGMAGIGKTYLANYIFKLHYLDFERSCFLEDIERRCMKPNALLDLQKQLLKDIRDITWMDVHDTDVATSKIEKLLLRKKTLLVLDGVDNFEQLDVLLGTTGLHPGSKIIITSKDASLTEKCMLFETEVPPKHKKHKLQGLDENESLQILSWHAFKGRDPKESYRKLARKVVKYCGGHPLALKVIGSSLHKEDVVAWEATLDLLEKEPNPHVQKVLQISFDSLPSKTDKELFKHIACFFIGEDKAYVEAILRGSMSTTFGFSKLIDRCLLAIGPRNELMMHQLLQEMARDLVRQESPEKPWKRSRLWHPEESYDVLRQEKGTTKIEGLVLDMKVIENYTSHGPSSSIKEKFGDDLRSKFGAFPLLPRICDILSWIWGLFAWVFLLRSSYRTKPGIKTNAFSKMDKLRLLQLDYVPIHGSYEHFPTGLRWLCMHGFPLSYVPLELQMENMVALDMSYSNLKHLWKKRKLLKSLKFLTLRSCRELVSVGHFDGFPVLERLMLAGCVSLVEVCSSIGNCDSLLLLDVSGCTKLKRLPRSIRLKNLRTLSIDGCSNLGEFLLEIKEMESLEVLMANNINIESQVSSCVMVEAIPRNLKSFAFSLPSSLVKLSIRNNNLSNESFPADFGSLSMLKKLYLDGNPIDSLPDCVRSLSRLEFLSLEECHRLKAVLCAPSTLKHLSIFRCESLEKITFHPDMSTPPSIYYVGTAALSEIEGVFKLQGLAEIDEEIVCSLGWINIQQHVKDKKLPMNNIQMLYQHPVVLPGQMFYQYGIFSTFFQGEGLPDWITHRSSLPIMNFTLRSSGKCCRIRGLNVCIVTKISSTQNGGFPTIHIKNSTKSYSWVYDPQRCVAAETKEEGIVWLSHWMFGNNEFEDGDEVAVFTECGSNVYVKEYGVSIVYDDEKEKDHCVCSQALRTLVNSLEFHQEGITATVANNLLPTSRITSYSQI